MVFNNAFSTGVRIHDGHVLLVDKATVSVEKDNYFIEKNRHQAERKVAS